MQLFFNLGTTGGFGVLSLVALTSVAVIVFFVRHPSGENAWRRVIAPVLAMILLVIVVILAIANYDILINVASDAPERWILPGLFLVAAAIGLLWAQFLKTTRPEVYDAIGRGANAATGISVLDLSAQEDEPGQPSMR